MRRHTVTKVCNEDCFNCPHDDCIIDGLGRKTKAAASAEAKTKRQISNKLWYQANKEKKNAQSRAYYQAHRDVINAKRRKKTIQ